VVAVAGPVTDPRHALWADRVEIPLVKGEVGIAETAGRRFFLAGSSTSRAADHCGVVRRGCRDLQCLTTETVKVVSGLQVTGIVLALAGRTGHEEPHANRMVQSGIRVNRIRQWLQET